MARKIVSKYEIESQGPSNKGRPELVHAELWAFADDWQLGKVPVCEPGTGINVPHPLNVGTVSNADKALIRHHLAKELRKAGIDKSAFVTFTGRDGAIKVTRLV